MPCAKQQLGEVLFPALWASLQQALGWGAKVPQRAAATATYLSTHPTALNPAAPSACWLSFTLPI